MRGRGERGREEDGSERRGRFLLTSRLENLLDGAKDEGWYSTVQYAAVNHSRGLGVTVRRADLTEEEDMLRTGERWVLRGLLNRLRRGELSFEYYRPTGG